MDKKEIKQIIEKRDNLRKKLEKNDKDANIRNITYYKEFELINKTFQYSGFSEEEVFLVDKQIGEGKDKKIIHEIYDRDNILIAKTDKEGKLNIENEYKERIKKQLGEYYVLLGLDDKERDLYLTQNYRTIENEKDKNFISKEIEYKVSDNKENKEQEDEIKEDTDKSRENKVDVIDKELIGQDLGIDPKDISKCIKIKDKRFYEKVPEARGYDGDAILAYSSSQNKFMVIGYQNGKYVQCESIEPSYGTMKTSIDLDRTGEDVETQPITGIMKIKGNANYDFAVNLEFGGTVEFQELRVDRSTGKYISADLRTQGQYQTSWEVEQLMDKARNRNIHDEVQEFYTEKRHGAQSTVQSLKNKKCTKEEKDKEEHDGFDRGERTPYRRPYWD